jgi:signal transduction histidine kinase
VLGASKLLTEPASGSAFDPERLHRMMTAELYRLGAVLDPDQQEPVVEFDLADVLDPLVLAHRIAGAEITVGLSATGVIGRPAAFATAVANILTNARTHAPGTPITIEAAAVGDTVMLTVADQGPGIAPAHRASVLEHGVRGIDSPGSGIGLHTAAAAMQVQGGSLEIGGAPGGGAAIRLTLPAARPMATTKEPVRSLVAKRVSPASASLPTLRTAG